MKRPNKIAWLAGGIAAGVAIAVLASGLGPKLGLAPIAGLDLWETVSVNDSADAAEPDGEETRKILYYRNPMGLPDTSPTPKKDSMGMDYIPVYADEANDDNAVRVSPGRIQRSGVRTEPVEQRPLFREVRGIGTIKHDESKLWAVTVRSDGYVEDLFVNRTGQRVEKGQPLFRFYSPQIQLAQADLLSALRAAARSGGQREREGAMQKLRNLNVPEERIEEVAQTKTNPRTLDWPAPATGHVIEKKVIEGQRVAEGDELFRIANHEKVWVIAEVAEADIEDIALGTSATVTLRAFPNAPRKGTVTFVYPEMLTPEARTVPVRIELPNPDLQMRPGMYADVTLRTGASNEAVVAVPADAVIDNGERRVVFVALGDGRFEPRDVTLGRKGYDTDEQGDRRYVEVLDGVAAGEEVVTSATFLIGSESNLKAALRAFEDEARP